MSVSAIVPLFNEGKTVGKVVQQLLDHPLIDEVICINDGSTDESFNILKNFGKKIQLISFKKNRGKGYALTRGTKEAKGDIVAFFDADLTSLRKNHTTSLILPLIEGKARAVLGYPTSENFSSFFKDVTGERAYYRKDLLPHLKKISKTNRFSLEFYLNSLHKKNEVKKISLKGLGHLFKYEKYHPGLAIKETVKDIVAITRGLIKGDAFRLEEENNIAEFIRLINSVQIKKRLLKIPDKKLRLLLKKYLLTLLSEKRNNI